MLYKISKNENSADSLEPLPFLDFADLGKLEKDLEIVIAEHLLDVLFEGAALMPIFQERALQAEADIYALNREGDLVIFELKRGYAGTDAMLQMLRYSQDAGAWGYNRLEEMHRIYSKSPQPLGEAHRDAFNLERPLLPSEFNRKQQLIIVGNAANDSLINAVDYWKRTGLQVNFLPYRVYNIGGEHYFEFFALPYDKHQNPATTKGVLFDTNRSYDPDSIWDMIEQKRISAYGGVKHVVEYLNPRDIVFYSHKWVGIVAAAEILGPVKSDGADECYRDVKFLTPVPTRDADTPLTGR